MDRFLSVKSQPPVIASKPMAAPIQKPVKQAVFNSGSGIAILEKIKWCESHDNYQDVNRSSGAGGAYQFMPGTWANFGGYSRAELAPPSVQDEKARETYARSGTTPWNASRGCWS